MTPHPEDAMTRERALEDAAIVLDSRVRDLRELYDKFELADGVAAIARDLRRALASAQQEPAPAAGAEEVITLERICELESLFQHDEIDSHHIREMLDALDALRRYAGDGGVTDEQVEAACKVAHAPEWYYWTNHQKWKADRERKSMRAALETAARAKPSEKGGGR